MVSQKDSSVMLKKGKKDVFLNYADLRKGVLVLRAVNHRLRQQIINLLSQNDQITVTDIYVKLRLEQSVASQHLAILRRSNIVMTERRGKYIYYTLNEERLALVAQLVNDLAK